MNAAYGNERNNSKISVSDFLIADIDVSCKKIEQINKNSSYFVNGLETAIYCYHNKKIDMEELRLALDNRLLYIRKKGKSALNDSKLYIDSYVWGDVDTLDLEIGRKLLIELLSVDTDVGGRYNFLLGSSYLRGGCYEQVKLATNYLDLSVSKGHMLAAASLSYIYTNGYMGIGKNKKNSDYYRNSFNSMAKIDNVSYKSAIDFLQRKKLLIKGVGDN